MNRKILDKGTYGNSPACEVLAERINQYQISPNRVGKFLTGFNNTLRELEKIDRKIGLGLAKMSYKKYYDLCGALPIEVNTYAQNVLYMYYRKWLEKVKAQKPTKSFST